MAAIPDVFIGRNTSSLTITGQAVASGGTLSDDASGALSVLAVSESVEADQANDTESIAGMTARRKNNVIVESESTYTITGFLLANDTAVLTTAKNKANAIAQNFDYVKLIFSRAGVTETFYGLIMRLNTKYNKGKCEFTLTIGMVDPGVANPAFA